MASKLNLNSTSLEELKAKAAALPEEKKIQANKTVTPTTSMQTILPDNGYDGFNQVIIDAIPNEYVIPSGSLKIAENGIHDVTNYANVEINIASAANGTEWTACTYTTTPSSSYFYNVCFAKNIWVAAGQKGLYYSYNGKHWENSNITSLRQDILLYAKGIFLAGDSAVNNGIRYSYDGKMWIESDAPLEPCKGICYAQGKWIAVFETSICCSYDGTTWSQVATRNFSTDTNYLCHADGIWIINTDDGVEYSTDGISWFVGLDHGTFSRDTCYGDGLWVTAVYNHGIYYSNDGITWTQSNITDGSYEYISYHNGIWLIGSSYSSKNGIYYSLDGKHWSPTNISGVQAGRSIYSNGVYICSDKTNAELLYSINGIEWNNSNCHGELYTGIVVNGLIVICTSAGLFYSIVWESR